MNEERLTDEEIVRVCPGGLSGLGVLAVIIRIMLITTP